MLWCECQLFCMILLFAILSLTGHVSTCIACFIIHYPWWRVISIYTKSSLSPWIINPISMLYFVHTCFLPNVINTVNSKNISHSSAFHCQTTGSHLRWKLFFPLQSLLLMNSKSLQSDVIDYRKKCFQYYSTPYVSFIFMLLMSAQHGIYHFNVA